MAFYELSEFYFSVIHLVTKKTEKIPGHLYLSRTICKNPEKQN